MLAAPLRAASGGALALPVSLAPAHEGASNAITIELVPSRTSADSESYHLVVTPRGVTLSAPRPVGLLHGLETIRQLLPPELERAAPARWDIPAVTIDDAPRFPYRGVLLDVARWYYPPEFIEKVIDLLALYKLNTLHLHLTDDQGWRLEIRKYPRLTEVGAWRKETILGQNFRPYIGDGKPHGGFYTQQQMREIVAYAAARHVTIVPEIEMPGHASAALAAYPELSCTGGPFQVSHQMGRARGHLLPERATVRLPGGRAHRGHAALSRAATSTSAATKSRRSSGRTSAVAQEVMRREKLANEEELQGWFIRRIESFLRAHGRRLIGWDETLEGGLAPEATVMSWRGTAGGIEAARQGHDVIMTPTSPMYFDYYQGNPASEPLAIGGFVPLDSVYAYEPVPAVLTPEQAAHVLGAQGNLWTEYIPTPAQAEYMLMPRMLALSEVLWSPKEARSWQGFVARLPAQLARLDAMNVRYRVPEAVR